MDQKRKNPPLGGYRKEDLGLRPTVGSLDQIGNIKIDIGNRILSFSFFFNLLGFSFNLSKVMFFKEIFHFF